MGNLEMPRDKNREGKSKSLGALLLGVAMMGLMGCEGAAIGQNGSTEAAVNKPVDIDPTDIANLYKKSGIEVGDGLYMIPTGIDSKGCEGFNPYSENGAVRTAIHYRQADGGFDIVRDAAVCQVEMVEMEPDEQGCQRYRAVPVNKDLPIQQEVVYYKADDGTFTPSRSKAGCS